MRLRSVLGALLLALTVAPGQPMAQEEGVEARVAEGAVLRGLDKINGELKDFEVMSGEMIVLGRLNITMDECRYPTGNRFGDAFAHLTIQSESADTSEMVFSGWMVASSPALNALDHSRYDIWVMRCISS